MYVYIYTTIYIYIYIQPYIYIDYHMYHYLYEYLYKYMYMYVYVYVTCICICICICIQPYASPLQRGKPKKTRQCFRDDTKKQFLSPFETHTMTTYPGFAVSLDPASVNSHTLPRTPVLQRRHMFSNHPNQ